MGVNIVYMGSGHSLYGSEQSLYGSEQFIWE